MAYATAEHVAAVLGKPLDEFDTYTADMFLDQATALIDAKVPSVASRITAGTLDPLIPQNVCARMVVRAMRNRLMSKSSTAGPFSNTPDDNGYVTLLDQDLADLAPPQSSRSPVGTINLGSPFVRRHTITLPDGTTREVYEDDQPYGWRTLPRA